MRVEIGPILRTDFCAQGSYSSIDVSMRVKHIDDRTRKEDCDG